MDVEAEKKVNLAAADECASSAGAGAETVAAANAEAGKAASAEIVSTEAGMAAVEIRGLEKAFGGVLLYDDFSFDIDEGLVTVLTGPSGCGKTTLLRMIAGLETPDRGTIRLAEAESGRRVAFVFQEDRLLPWLTVKENMSLVLPRGQEGQSAEQIEELLNLLELSGFGDYRPEQLSGGMRGRAAIGRALLYAGSRPARASDGAGPIFLMDEPFKGLDDALKFRLMTALSAEWKQRGCTVALVTHDRADAGFLGDRVWEFTGQPVRAGLLYSR